MEDRRKHIESAGSNYINVVEHETEARSHRGIKLVIQVRAISPKNPMLLGLRWSTTTEIKQHLTQQANASIIFPEATLAMHTLIFPILVLNVLLGLLQPVQARPNLSHQQTTRLIPHKLR